MEATKEYLNTVRRLSVKIKRKEEELEILKIERASTGNFSTDEKVKSSKSKDKVSALAIEIVTLEKEIEELRAEKATVKKDINSILNEIEDEKLYSVLHLRYIQGKTVEAIADELGYTDRHIRNLNNDAIEVFKLLREKR